MTLRKPIAGHPAYEIAADGVVWRVAPSQLDSRWGPVPRQVKPVMLGCYGSRSPHVRLCPPARLEAKVTRSILSLMKEHWPGVRWP